MDVDLIQMIFCRFVLIYRMRTKRSRPDRQKIKIETKIVKKAGPDNPGQTQ
jgi:hypothetical protein